MKYLTIHPSAHVDSEASSERLAVVTQVFETCELVENILFQLSRKGLSTCDRVNSYISSVIERPHALHAHHYDPFPAHHNITWSKEGAGPVKCRTGPTSLRAASYRHNDYGYKQPHTVIPVALNDAILDLRSDKKLHRDYARSFFPNANMTDDEALSLVIHQRMQYPSTEFTAAIDNGIHGALDMAFTDPPVSHLEAVLYDPDSVHEDNAQPVDYLWASRENCRRVIVRCSKGIRVRHVVAAVLEELDEKWVEQLWQPGAKYTVLDKKNIIVSKEMMDFVKEKGIVDHPGRRLRRRNYEATYGDMAHEPESD
ncbi:hypothetical protein CKM354_000182700 [Cercospora kikuchii]|uniref:Uncharacterized protein n=1 Tax=Cercospora kikuchii TaxID=84275 RepID=A0A9P3CEA7_9PEZI|nr:uncharacterized protein CKM354_000182700 [Cercospora kikuchii]GIZ38410.1 hypothetical protein CKM354_000182700 [Cercospora kikuchii]